MLNRRILRAKTVQYLYGLLQANNANYHLAIENINESFAPDLNSMEPQDKVQLARDAEKAIEVFTESVTKKQILPSDLEPKIKKAVVNAQLFLENAVKKDTKFSANTLISQTEEVKDSYVLSLQILCKVLEYLENTYAKKHSINPSKPFAIRLKIEENKDVYSQNINEDTLDKINDLSIILYRDVFSLNPQFDELFTANVGDIEAEKALVKDVVKTELFKSDLFENIIEEQDFDWSENKIAVKDLVNKTLKNLTIDVPANEILIGISANWDEDKNFMQQLFVMSIESKEQYTKFITDKLQNWDLSRIAEIDLAILIVSIAEMINFPSIPVKVTINEFLEIAKVYGTPKSKDFINGILDKISVDLVEKEIIKKSGRGLIDNK